MVNIGCFTGIYIFIQCFRCVCGEVPFRFVPQKPKTGLSNDPWTIKNIVQCNKSNIKSYIFAKRDLKTKSQTNHPLIDELYFVVKTYTRKKNHERPRLYILPPCHCHCRKIPTQKNEPTNKNILHNYTAEPEPWHHMAPYDGRPAPCSVPKICMNVVILFIEWLAILFFFLLVAVVGLVCCIFRGLVAPS